MLHTFIVSLGFVLRSCLEDKQHWLFFCFLVVMSSCHHRLERDWQRQPLLSALPPSPSPVSPVPYPLSLRPFRPMYPCLVRSFLHHPILSPTSFPFSSHSMPYLGPWTHHASIHTNCPNLTLAQLSISLHLVFANCLVKNEKRSEGGLGIKKRTNKKKSNEVMLMLALFILLSSSKRQE